ncbi:hypothetical protein SDC9_161299 [bioreactor metagenome]|uniref:Uncharacterized protein n=1 Tax=bioreactor metagenome TaxID=1076179 RepID=A0A645FP54_9ZZZZ
MAALLIGKVSAIPTNTATKAPINIGCISVAFIIKFPNVVINADTAGPVNCATKTPTIIVTAGVTSISTLVSLETIFPNSTANMVAKKAPTGPPNSFPQAPTKAQENITKGGA